MEKYGADFLDLICEYCAERGLAGKSGPPRAETVPAPRGGAGARRRQICEDHQAGRSIDELARELNIEPGTVESHLCHGLRDGRPPRPRSSDSDGKREGERPNGRHKKSLPPSEEGFLKADSGSLLLHHVHGGGPFAALLDVERYPVAFRQRLKPTALDGGIVNENIVATFPRDKSKALFLIKPLHDACCHDTVLLTKR